MAAERGHGPVSGALDRLVQRYGATPVSAAASLLFALPLVAWGGTVDLYPSFLVWATGAVGLALVAPWLLIARHAFALQAQQLVRSHRFEWSQMSRAERVWAGLAAAGASAIVGWLNAAATVDLPALGPGLAAGRLSIYVFTGAALAVLVSLAVLTAYCWRRNRRAYRRRAEASAPGPQARERP